MTCFDAAQQADSGRALRAAAEPERYAELVEILITPTTCSVEGPFEVPFYQGKGGRTITEEDDRAFWDDHDHLGSHRHCDVFGIRAGKGAPNAAHIRELEAFPIQLALAVRD